MKTKTRVVSLLLTACMMLSLCAALPFAASAEVVSTSGWDGETATQPEGLGTLENPYLIANAENLLWIQKQIPHGDAATDEEIAAGKAKVAFSGTYFLQTQDIDLNGKNFKSIGYYFSNPDKAAAFGGIYDGQGFSIRNGKIVSNNTSHNHNLNWGNGLFGMIYGATIKNIVLDCVQVEGYGIVGAIVGRAAATKAQTDATFNIIENCVVKANCSVTALMPSAAAAPSSGSNGWYDEYNADRAGGIVGVTYATTVRYCTNAAKIEVPTYWRAVGGIAGSYGYYSKIEYCVNTGNIRYGTEGQKNDRIEASMGGIAGFIYPDKNNSGYDMNWNGTAVMENCYNSGELTFVGNMGAAFHLGGILGGINTPEKPDGGAKDTITNCYNLFAFNFADHTSLGTKTGNFRVAGILGSAWCGGNSDCGTLWIGNSASVTVEANHYAGTNEYRYQTNQTASGYYPVEPVKDADGVSTVTTKTAEELAPLTKAIDDAISAFRDAATARKVGMLAYQLTTGDTNSVRISAQIVGKDYLRVGFKVYASYRDGDTLKTSAVEDVALYTYYTSLKADGEDVLPAEGNNFIAFVIDEIPTDKGNVTFTITPYVVEENGTSFGDTASVTFDAAGNVVQ